MNDDTLIDYLEELAEKFGVQIRYEDIKQDENLTFVVGGKGDVANINNIRIDRPCEDK